MGFKDDDIRMVVCKRKKLFDMLYHELGYCKGEIIGLFKFTYRGRNLFCDMFRKLEAEYAEPKAAKPIPIYPWPQINNFSDVKPVHEIQLDEMLLGSFLDYLKHKSRKLNIITVEKELDCYWVEIDHYLDLCRASKWSEPLRMDTLG